MEARGGKENRRLMAQMTHAEVGGDDKLPEIHVSIVVPVNYRVFTV